MGEVELMALYWTVCGPGGGPRRPRVEHVQLARPLRARRQGRLQGARACGTPTSSISSRRARCDEMKQVFDDAGLRVPGGRVPGRLLRRRRATRCARTRTSVRKLLFDTAATFDAHHIKVGNIPGTPCELDGLIERYAELCAGRRQAHQREGRLRVHAVRRQRPHARHGADARRPSADAAERRPCDRHLAHGQARHRARGAASASRRSI